MNRLRVALFFVLTLLPFHAAFAEIYSANDDSISTPYLLPEHYVTGDGNVTIDSLTNLAWLDVTLSSGLSSDEVTAQLGAGGYFSGYRVAKQAEVVTLLEHAGIMFPSLPEVEFSEAFIAFASLFGAQDIGGGSELGIADGLMIGFDLDEGGFSDTCANIWSDGAVKGYEGVSPDSADMFPVEWLGVTANQGSVWLSYGLVRNASEIPEPSSLVLASLGLLGATGMVRVQRRRRASAVRP